MKILTVICLIVTATNADIGLKLRQQRQQYLQQNGGSNFGGDIRNNPFFIPKTDGGSFGSAGSAATNVEQRANGNAKTERTHTLEELCNDAFHSFLCKPVNGGKRRRIDGNLRPGAVIPPGVLRPESSNTRENKLLPPLQSGSETSPNRAKPNNAFDRVPSAQSEQGYFYPKPSNKLEIQRPLNNGYLPPDNGFRFTTPPTTRFPLVTTRQPQTTRLPPITFPPTTRRLVTFATTPRPIFTTRIPTTRPSTIFTTPRPIFTQPIKYETFPQRQQQIFNTYLPPVTTRFASPQTPRPIYSRPPPTLPPSTLPPFRFTSTTLRPSTPPPVTFITSTPKYQTLSNTYLPPFAEQKLNPVYVSTTTTTPRPTFQTVSVIPFQTSSPNLASTYLPPNNPAIDIRFGSASNNRQGNALVPDAAQNPSVTVRPDDENNLERLCNDPFHSFLCQPITKTRQRFDGRLRPQAVIPQGVFLQSSSNLASVKSLLEQQSGTDLQPTIVPSNSGYTYLYPNNIQQNSQAQLFGYIYPMPSNLQQNLLLSPNGNTVSNTGYFYPAPSSNGLASTSISSSQSGYEYPTPSNNQQLSFISTTLEPDISSITEQYSTVSTTPKPFFQNNQFLQENLLSLQNTNNQPYLLSTAKSQSIETGYDYPKPSFNQQFTIPSSTPSTPTVTIEYVNPKTDNQFVFSSTTPRPTQGFETVTTSSPAYTYQSTLAPQVSQFTGYENSNPSNGQTITISTTERPSTLVYDYQNPVINQVSPSLPQQTLINYQKPSTQTFLPSGSAQGFQSTGYDYPKPDKQLQEEQTVNTAEGYFYPKPSSSFPDNNFNSLGNSQFFKNDQNPIFNTFSKGVSYPSIPNTFSVNQQPSDQEADQKTAKNINQLLGPSSEANNRDLPPASQFEVLKVRKRQNG